MPELPPFPPEPDENADALGSRESSSSEGEPEVTGAVDGGGGVEDASSEQTASSDPGPADPAPDEAAVEELVALEGDDEESSAGGLEDLRQQIITRLGEAQQSLLGLIDHYQAEHQHAATRAESVRSRLEQELDEVRADLDRQRGAVEAAEATRLEAEQALEAAQARLIETEETLETERRRAEESSSSPQAALAVASETPTSSASLSGLRHSIAALDAGATQTEVLSRLLEEATGYAGRAALLLSQGDSGATNVWNSSGFGDALEQGAEANPPEALLRVLEGRPVGGSEAAWEVDDLEPTDAVAVPLILRDRVRAVLYADRTEAKQPFDSDALQILTYCAAEALETLPLRSLRPVGTLVDATPSLDTETGTVEAEAIGIEAPAEELVVEEIEEGVAVEEPAEAETTDEVGAADTLELEPEDVTAEAEETPEALEVETAELDVAELEVGELEVGQEPEPPVTVPPPEHETSDADPAVEPEADTSAWELHEEAAEAEPAPPPTWPAPVPDAEDLARERVVEEETPAADEPEAEVATAEEPPEESDDGEAFKTQAIRLDQISASGTDAQPKSAEVVPPSDVQGPGWAFTGSALGDTPAANEDPMHEEARRLARLLVSEIKLYNEEQIEEGNRQGNIYRFLKEPIDRSRVLYEERIDERVRSDSNYYEDELVRSLANGDRDLLGL